MPPGPEDPEAFMLGKKGQREGQTSKLDFPKNTPYWQQRPTPSTVELILANIVGSAILEPIKHSMPSQHIILVWVMAVPRRGACSLQKGQGSQPRAVFNIQESEAEFLI